LLKEKSDAERLTQILAMREEGKTLQQIADELGYKSVGSVHYVLNKNQIFNFSKTL